MDLLYPVPVQATPCHQKSPSRLSTSNLLVNFKLHLYFPRVGWVGVGGWVVIVNLKVNLSSTDTGLPTGTELGNKSSAWGRGKAELGFPHQFYYVFK